MGDGLFSFQFYTLKAKTYSTFGWAGEGKEEVGKVKQNSHDKIKVLNFLRFSRCS